MIENIEEEAAKPHEKQNCEVGNRSEMGGEGAVFYSYVLKDFPLVFAKSAAQFQQAEKHIALPFMESGYVIP